MDESNGFISEALRANMRRLRGERAIGVLRTEMAERNIHVGTSTLHRADKGELGIRVESLVKIGQFFGIPADRLLRPDLGVRDVWPFADVELFERVEKLDKPGRNQVEGAIRAVVADLEKRTQPNQGKSTPSQSGASQRRSAG